MCYVIDRKTHVGCRSCVGVKTLEDGALSVIAIMSYAYCQFILCRDHNAMLAYSRLLTQLRCHISMWFLIVHLCIRQRMIKSYYAQLDVTLLVTNDSIARP